MFNGMSEERPKHKKRTIEYDEKTTCVYMHGNKEECEKSFLHRKPKSHPLYKMEEKRGGELLKIQDSPQAQCDDTKALINMLKKNCTFEGNVLLL